LPYLKSAKHPKRQERQNLKYVQQHPSSLLAAIYGTKQKTPRVGKNVKPFQPPPYRDVMGLRTSSANKPLPGYNVWTGKGPIPSPTHGFNEADHPRDKDGKFTNK
jgi:hypothetical protein